MLFCDGAYVVFCCGGVCMHGIDPFFASEAFTEASGDEAIEYFDVNNRRLLVNSKIMPLEGGLWRRKIGVILYDMRRRVYVCRRKAMHEDTHKEAASFWDIFATGFVHLDESSEDAALRHIEYSMGNEPVELKPILNMTYEPCSWFVSLYAMGPTHARPSSVAEQFSGQFMDRHEVKALYEYAPELCTPLLSWCFTSHVLWRVHD